MNGLGDRAVLAVPGVRAPMEDGHEVRIAARKLGLQEAAEQVVIAVPLATSVEWNEEQIRPLDPGKRLAAPRSVGHGVAQRRAEPGQDRGLQQEALDLRLEGREDLLAEIIDEMPVVAGELQERGTLIRLRPEPEHREVDGRDPTLRPGGQQRQLGVVQAEVLGDPNEARRFLRRQPQIVRSNLGKPARDAKRRQREWRIGPGGDDQPNTCRQVFEQIRDEFVASGFADHVVVVEDENDPFIGRGEIVEQRADCRADIGSGHPQDRLGVCATREPPPAQGADDIAPEESRVVLGALQ